MQWSGGNVIPKNKPQEPQTLGVFISLNLKHTRKIIIMNFNIEIGKMLEIIAKYPIAERFAYVFTILFFISAVLWLSPDFLKALADFILTMKNS